MPIIGVPFLKMGLGSISGNPSLPPPKKANMIRSHCASIGPKPQNPKPQTQTLQFQQRLLRMEQNPEGNPPGSLQMHVSYSQQGPVFFVFLFRGLGVQGSGPPYTSRDHSTPHYNPCKGLFVQGGASQFKVPQPRSLDEVEGIIHDLFKKYDKAWGVGGCHDGVSKP